jgi:hypothetical protein
MKINRLKILFRMMVGLITWTSVQWVSATDKVLILGDTVINGSSSLEAKAAAALGYQVDVQDASWWTDPSRTSADFGAYRAIILGDPECTEDPTPMQAAETTTNVWGPIVNGNVIIIGTDPVYHAINGGGGAPAGAKALISKGIAFAAAQPGKTGFYISLSCDYSTASPNTPVPVLQPFGVFTLEMAPSCYNKSHITATDSALAGLSDYLLSGWSCSVHEIFDSWPTNFQVLAIARDLGSVYSAPDGTVGTPYILARGVTTITNGCGLISVGNGQISSSNFTFSALGPDTSTWNVYASTNLTNWTVTGSTTLDSSGNGSFTDTNITGIPYRFYKLSDSNCCSQAIGFTRIQVGAGSTNSPGTNSMLANQLDQPINTLDGLFNVNGSGTMPDGTALPNGSEIDKWDDASQTFLHYTWNSSTGWSDGNASPAGTVTLNPGEGAFLAVTNALTATFVGTVREGNLSLPLTVGGWHVISAMVPKAGGLQTSLSYAPHVGDIIERWTGPGTGYTVSTYIPFGGAHWNPQEPVINVGQAFFWQGTNNTWQINFSPCQ